METGKNLLLELPAFPCFLEGTSVDPAQGLRTVVVTDKEFKGAQLPADANQNNERWTSYPDDNPVRSYLPGDSRAAMAPFLAHAQLELAGESYDWMLFGDDDTVFFIDNVLHMLPGFDADLPYLISDNHWFSDHGHQNDVGMHPHPNSPRCRPCHSTIRDEEIVGRFKPPVGCPCTRELLCMTDQQVAFNAWCDMPRVPFRSYSFHGGAGAIISAGLMRAVDAAKFEHCVLTTRAPGGDSMLSICLWEQGFGPTDPGPGLLDPEILMFDPGTEDRMGLMGNWSAALEGKCDSRCAKRLRHTLSLHLKSSNFEALNWAADYMRAMAQLYHTWRRWHADQTQRSYADVAEGKARRARSRAQYAEKGRQAWLRAADDALQWEEQRRQQWAAMSKDEQAALKEEHWRQLRAGQRAHAPA